MGKLTKAQQATYDQMMRDGRFVSIDTYKPALKLAELGVARLRRLNFGAIEITPQPPFTSRS